ncbi:hypothetical protein GGH94_004956 [Coemansia aciculifera]|uniref:Secreted protein n=1 Tax=Coemansia aciculifera TaxID=417176 RepID=A0A9W8IKY5_9FUNG|nr:hypothetical protein GGH94_004956 [Coemansia aciculifera]KAJ2872016.1 hypothetical protein GGH93_004372 [Coemansia aciculifera]
MQIFATLVVAATAVLAQQIGSEQGPSVSSGETALSHPNVNNGWQSQNSLVNTGSDGGNVFNGLHGNTFSTGFTNGAISDSNFINPSQNQVSGNTGSTANGEKNHIGDFFTAPVAFRKRDVAFNNNFGHGGYDRGYDHGYDRSYVVPAPVYEVPVYGRPEYGRPEYEHPSYGRPEYGRPEYGRPEYGRPQY